MTLVAMIGLGLAATAPVRDVDRVLVVRNENSAISRAVAADYMRRRGVRNVVSVRCPDSAASAANETVSYEVFARDIEAPIRAWLQVRAGVDFIVLTKGVPLRIADVPGLGTGGKRRSLDSVLAAIGYRQNRMARPVNFGAGGAGGAYLNRFWNSYLPFSHSRFGGFLVTRLDGYTQADAVALTSRSLAAEKARPTGPVLLDSCAAYGYGDPSGHPIPLMSTGARAGINSFSYKTYNTDMQRAAQVLRSRSVKTVFDQKEAFVGFDEPLAGYVSWGSNDRKFSAETYRSLRFAPGAVVETAVSTSARTMLPTSGGQSLIADLVAQGATGAKGYTDEPYLLAVASPTVLFDRLARGWTLAESYYAASRCILWQDVVLGDPICRPFKVKAAARPR